MTNKSIALIRDLCGMKVAIVSATEQEIIQAKNQVGTLYNKENQAVKISFLITGTGILASCFSITRLIAEQKPDLIIQAGIAGSFDENIVLGAVVAVKAEFAGDTGVEENGIFKDLFDLNLQSENLFPYANKQLVNPWLNKFNLLHLQEVVAITVNEISTRKERIELLKAKYSPVIESMEGASLHYACLQNKTPFIQIRSVSNYIGERDKSKWKFKEAFNNLAQVLLQYIDQLNLLSKNEEGMNSKIKSNDIYNRF